MRPMSRAAGLKRALIVATVVLAVTATAALAADPTDTTFGRNGIAQIEARFTPPEDFDQVGGIADLEPTRGGKMLAAVYPIARDGHYFAAARFRSDGSPDRSFGTNGFTRPVSISSRKRENGGVLQAEAVAGLRGGKVLLAGYYENYGEFSPALVRFTSRGSLDPSFGRGGKVIPSPSFEGRPIGTEGGGELLHDVAIQPDGTIVGVGDLVAAPRSTPGVGPKRPGAVVIAYRPDGKIDRGFGHAGRFRIVPARSGRFSGYTGFTDVKALPSGKLLVSGYIHQRYVLYRLTADGRIDRGFGRNGRVAFAKPGSRSIRFTSFFEAPFAVDPQGRIVLCVPLFPEGPEEPIAFLRLLSDGRRDPSLRPVPLHGTCPIDGREPHPRKHGVQGFQFEPQGIAIDGHGRIVVAGIELAPFTRGQDEPGYQYFAARRFLSNGRRDRSFGRGGVWETNPPGSQSMARAALTQPNGKVVAGGSVQIERGGGAGASNTAMMLTRYR
jgi:uncharacterized delta-60 repeat protein